jgi:hypothetical protein
MRGAAWLIAVAVVGFLIWKLRQTARRVLGANGRTYVLVTPAGRPNAAGIAQSSVWRADPDDGHRYTPDLAFELGGKDSPMFSRFV